jgi:hypothetical protein
MDLQRKRLRKRIRNFGTWNIHGTKGKFDFITKDLGNLKMDIITLKQRRRKWAWKTGDYICTVDIYLYDQRNKEQDMVY